MISTVLHRVVAQPLVYDCVQTLAGFETLGHTLTPWLADTAGRTVLDIGAGTGNYRRFMPASARYIWMDPDSQKLSGYRAKQIDGLAALGSGTQLCFGDRSIDYAFCACVSHHLDEPQLDRLFAEAARVVRRQFIFVDPIACPGRWISDLLWRYDRGSFPRAPEVLQAALERYFDLDRTDLFTIYHRYFLCLATPRQ